MEVIHEDYNSEETLSGPNLVDDVINKPMPPPVMPLVSSYLCGPTTSSSFWTALHREICLGMRQNVTI